MAKKGKKTGVAFITNIIFLVLSVLLVSTFFMPTFAETTLDEDNNVSYNGIVLTQAVFMDDNDAEQAVKNSLNVVKYNADERANYVKLVAAYKYAHDEDNIGFAATTILYWFVLLVGIIGIILSILNLVGKDQGKSLIGVSAVGSVLTILIAILASTYVNSVYDWCGLVTGAGVWIALASSVLALGSAITGKVVKK